MTAQEWVFVIGAVGTNLVAIIGAFVILVSKMNENSERITRKLNANTAKIEVNTKLTEENHHMMNSQRDEQLTYQRQLVDALSAHGINIPRDTSIKEPPTDR